MRCLYMIVGEAGIRGGLHHVCVDLIMFFIEWSTHEHIYVVVVGIKEGRKRTKG
jgi:hypothetical protein